MSKIKLYLLLTTIYIVIAIIFTWPMPLRPNTVIYGYPGDSFGTLWRLRWYKDARQTTDFSYNPNLAAPFGTYFAEEVNPIAYLGPLKILTFLTNEVFAYNFFIFASFVLTPLFTFFLLDYLMKNKKAAFIGSLIFNLAPCHFWHAFNHPDLAQIQWMPLYILVLLHLEKRKNIKAALLAAASYLLVFYTSFYYGYFMFLFTAVFLFFKLGLEILRQKKAWFNLKALQQRFLVYSIFALTIFIFMLPTIKSVLFTNLSGETSSTTNIRRSLDDLVAMSARPWDYIVPSINHPVFGKYTDQFYDWVEHQFSDFKALSTFVQERTIYLGIVNLILGIIGLIGLIGRRKKRTTVIIFFLTAIILALISGPPYVGIRAHTIYLPSYYLFNLSSFLQRFRVYARLGVVVLLCVTVISAYGVKYSFERLSRKFLLPTSYFLLLIVLIIFDFLNFPPFNVTDVGTISECYQWLADQPGDFIFVENPDLYAYTDALLFQRIHQKKIFNMMGGFLHDTIWPLVADVNSEGHVDHLKSFGVEYIFLHTKNIFPPDELDDLRYMRTAMALEIDKMPKKLEVAKQCPEGVIYKIKDFRPKDKIYVVREKSETWFPTGDWELQNRISYLFIANATGETKVKHLSFEADTQALEIRIDNSGEITKIIDNVLEIPPGLTRVVVINKDQREDIVFRNLRLQEISCTIESCE